MAAKKADFDKWAADFRISPVVARILRNRDLTEEGQVRAFLYGTLADCHSPWLLKDMDKAVGYLLEAVEAGTYIRVIGDYDVDGICSAYILTRGLQFLGAKVDTAIPHRIHDGYGLNDHLIQEAKEDGVGMILTCDNGIAAHQEVAQAKAMGMTVIVTDHHNIPYEEKEGRRIPVLPPADAVIDPKQEDCPYPFSELCGAAIAYKLISALYERCGLPKEELEESLILAAVATVGDVMDLQGENRILVKEGLRRLPHTKSPGLQALLEVNDLTGEVSAYHIGFVLGPCINASGRLDTAQRSLQLLLETDPQRAAVLAGDLLHMNESRKSMTAVQVEEAVRLVEAGTYGDDKILVIYLPKCHESLAGIVAGRVRERCHRPVFILTDGEQDVKGSGRSIEAYPMYDGLNACSDLLVRFGGHAMAAGLSIHREDVDELRRRLNGQCTLTEQDMIPKTVIDVPMPISYVTEELIRQMSLLEPFGKGNAKPLFAERDIRVRDYRILGKNKNVVRMDLETSDGCCRPGICFTDVEKVTGILAAGRPVSILYYPQIHEYRGSRDIQIVIQGIQAVSD